MTVGCVWPSRAPGRLLCALLALAAAPQTRSSSPSVVSPRTERATVRAVTRDLGTMMTPQYGQRAVFGRAELAKPASSLGHLWVWAALRSLEALAERDDSRRERAGLLGNCRPRRY